MANDMNVTLHFNYEEDQSGYQRIKRTLDSIEESTVNSMKLKGFDQVEIDRVKNSIYEIRKAIDNSFDLSTQKYQLGDMFNDSKIQESIKTVQMYSDNLKVSIDQTSQSYDSGSIKLDKYTKKIENFKLTLANAFRYNVVNRAIDMITNSIRQMIDYVIELDSALNSIRIVTGKSSDEMLQFAAANQESAKELGRTATEYAQASLIFYQQGLDDNQVKERTDAALKLANITGQTVQETTNQMTAIWNNFDDGIHSLEYYEDVITALGATTASSSSEIASGLEKFAAIADTVGLSYEYAASALATVVATTRQSEDVVGTAFKTMFARLQSLKLGETLDDGTTLTKYSKALEDIGVNILDQNGNLKDMDIILDEIGAKWQTLDRNQQTALANTVGGVRQYAQFIALFDNWDFFQQNVNTALESAGTVAKQNEIYMESYEAKVKQIKATLDSIKFDMFMGQDFGKLLDFADSFLVTLRVVLKDFGGFNQLLLIGGGLIAQLFAPQLITKFAIALSQVNTKMNLLQSMNPFSGLKDTITFINNSFQHLQQSQLGNIDKAKLLKLALKDLGPSGKQVVEDLIINYDNLNKKIIEVNNKILELQKNKTSFDSKGNVFNNDLVKDFSTFASEQGINIDSKILNNLFKEPIKDVEDLHSRIEQLINILSKLPNYKNIDLKQLFGYQDLAQITQQSKELNNAANNASQSLITVEKAMRITKTATAAAVAVRGLVDAFSKFSDGDMLGGISQSLTSIGSALMMTGEGTTMAVGGIMMGAGTLISVIKSQIEKAKNEAKQALDEYINIVEQVYDENHKLDELLNKYNKLSNKSMLSIEEQQEFKDLLIELRDLMGEEDYSIIAYYDEYGNAVYKTAEDIRELIKAKKENNELEVIEAEKEANKGKATLQQKPETVLTYERAVDKYNDINSVLHNGLSSLSGDIEKIDEVNKLLGTGWDLSTSTEQMKLDLENLKAETENQMRAYEQSVVDWYKDNNETFISQEITLPIKTASLEIDDATGKNLYMQLMGSLTNYAKSHPEDIANLGVKEMLDALRDIEDFTTFATGQDLNALEQIKTVVGEDSIAYQLLTEILEQNGNAFEAHSNKVNQNTEVNKEYYNSLKTASEDIDVINEVLDEFQETNNLSVDTMLKLIETFDDTDGLDEFIELLQNGNVSSKDFEEGLQTIVNNWASNLDIVKNVTSETVDEVNSQLMAMGLPDNTEYLEEQARINEALEFEGVAAEIAKSSNEQLKQSWDNIFNAYPQLEEALVNAGFNLDDLYSSAEDTRTAIQYLRDQINSPMGGLDTSVPEQALIELENEADTLSNKLLQLSITATTKGLAANLLKKILKNTQNFKYKGTGTGKNKGGGGGGGGGSGGEPYEAQLTGYEKVEDELEIIENRLKRIREEEKNTDDIEEKIKLRQQESELLKEQQVKLHEINDLQRKDIADNIQKLRDNGFIIDYDPDAQEWIVHNREHLHDLNDELEKDMEQMIKDTDSLIDSTRKYSEEWREANKIIKETDKDIQKLKDQQLKEEMDAFNDSIDDQLFYTKFYEGLESGLPKIQQIYRSVLDQTYGKLQKLYDQGLTDVDDQVQKLWTNILKYQKELDSLEDKIFKKRLENIDKIADILPNTIDNYERKAEAAQKRIELRNEKINELLAKGTEEALDQVLDLVKDNAKDIEEEYKNMIAGVKAEQNEMKDLFDGVGLLIDEEIDKLKQQQEEAKKINEEKEKEIELMKLQMDLENARNQKTVRVYRRGQGFVWEANKKAIQEAEKALDDYQKKNEEDQYQKQIDELEEYKKLWTSIPKRVEEAQLKEKAAQLLGTDAMADIYARRTDIIDDYYDHYEKLIEKEQKLEEQRDKKIEEQAAKVPEVEEPEVNKTEDIPKDAERKYFYVGLDGVAPEIAKLGDIILTAGGMFMLAAEGMENAIQNPDTGQWSIKLNNDATNITEQNAGTEITDPALIESINKHLELQGKLIDEILPASTEEITNNTSNISNMATVMSTLDSHVNTYTEALIETVKHGQDLTRITLQASNEAQDYARIAKQEADRAEAAAASAAEGPHHSGLESGPVGSIIGGQTYDKNLMRIARGELKNDEVLSLLQKGEAVFTPEQLDNVVGALNYSLNSVDKLRTLNNKMFSLGQLSTINPVPNDDNIKQQTITFGNINITMNGVNDIDSFSAVLKNNIKGIFAQTIAKE